MRYQWTLLLLLSALVGIVTFGLDDLPPEPEPVVTVESAIRATTTSSTTTTTLPQVQITRQSVWVDKQTTTTSSSTTTTTLPAGLKCPDLWPYIVAWWPVEQAVTVDRIVWAESRCIHDIVNPNGDDIGVTQINWPTWSTFVNGHGYTRNDLKNPAVNLLIAKLISEEAVAIGWRWCQPWDASGEWC